VKLLIDENISPIVGEKLPEHDIKLVRNQNLGASDKKVVEIAEEENRVILTQDDDFGRIYYFSNPEIRILVIKPEKQENSEIADLIQKGLKEIKDENKGLFIVSKDKVRVRK
jgi:predicted nuclease of predicted toxin-antitoxin system